MLKKLIAHNFRTHEDLTMDFHPGVNVIHGIGGSGKTNIIRAISWVYSNKPKFEKVHSHFAKDKETMVSLIFDNGVAELVKTSTTNKFSDGNGNSFSYTGATVPIPIAQLMNMGEINFSFQLAEHFLITSTPGDIGKFFNRITKIEKIDSWISKLTTISNKTKWKIEELESECVEIEKEISQYDGVEDLEKEITEHEKLCVKFGSTYDRLEYLNHISQRIKVYDKRISGLQNLDENLNLEFVYLETMIIDGELIQSKMSDLSARRQRIQIVLRKKQKLEEILIEEENMKGMEELLKDIEKKSTYQRSILQWDEYEYQVKVLTSTIGVKKKAYLDAVKELGICPVCQNEISIEHIHNLEASL